MQKHKGPYSLFYQILGFYPNNINLYEQAFVHRSSDIRTQEGQRINNERLEFLGDAILDAVVSDILNAATQEAPEYAHFKNVEGEVDPAICFDDNWQTGYYLRIGGEAAQKARAALEKRGIQIAQEIALDGDLAIIIDQAHEQDIQAAAQEMGGVAALLRMQ